MAGLVFARAQPIPGVSFADTVYPTSIIIENSGARSSVKTADDLEMSSRVRALEDEVARLRNLELEFEQFKNTVIYGNAPAEPPATYEPDSEGSDSEESWYNDDEGLDEDEAEEEDQTQFLSEEFYVRLSDKLRLVDLSARAVDVLNSITLSMSWSICSRTTYGFFIRNILLMGSYYKNQLVEDTSKLLFLSFTGVFFSAGMQFILAYYLFVKMPDSYQGDGSTVHRTSADNGDAPLPSTPYPTLLYGTPNDVCRTVQIVQIVSIGLFLFYIFNNVPGIIKNTLIIWRSERFISKDEDEVTKIHYWRESDAARINESDSVRKHCITSLTQGGEAANDLRCYYCDDQMKSSNELAGHVCDYCGKGMEKDAAGFRCDDCDFDVCNKCVAPSGKSVMQTTFRLAGSDAAQQGTKSFLQYVWPIDLFKPVAKPLKGEDLPRSFFEVTDMRNFLGEVLQDLQADTKEPVKGQNQSSQQSKTMSFADKAKVNLVRVDYLSPNPYCYPEWTILLPFFHSLKRLNCSSFLRIKSLDDAIAQASGRKKAKEGLDDAASDFYKASPKQFKDLPYFVELYPFKFRFIFFRIIAFLLGVIPEVVTLLMITITGVQYILWSGYKLGSDSNGIEEIILATVAITFIYDIDDAVYEHILPEFYKEAHERDKFEILGWVPLGSSKPMVRVLSWKYNWKIFQYTVQGMMHKFFGFKEPARLDLAEVAEHIDVEPHAEGDKKKGKLAKMDKCLQELKGKWDKQHPTRKGKSKFPAWEEGNIPLSKTTVFEMTEFLQYNDFYLALQYPFLYAKKFNFVFSGHLWQKFLDFYSTRGLHYFLLLTITLAIVGRYRLLAKCNRFAPSGWNQDSVLSVWATQNWPQTCIMSMGSPVLPGGKISDLYNLDGQTTAVSCGYNGYLPDFDEEYKVQVSKGYADPNAVIPSN